MAFTCTTRSFSLQNTINIRGYTNCTHISSWKWQNTWFLIITDWQEVRTIAGHRRALPEVRQIPLWTSPRFPRWGCPAPQTLQYQNPSWGPAVERTCIRDVFVWVFWLDFCSCKRLFPSRFRLYSLTLIILSTSKFTLCVCTLLSLSLLSEWCTCPCAAQMRLEQRFDGPLGLHPTPLTLPSVQFFFFLLRIAPLQCLSTPDRERETGTMEAMDC